MKSREKYSNLEKNIQIEKIEKYALKSRKEIQIEETNLQVGKGIFKWDINTQIEKNIQIEKKIFKSRKRY